MKNNQTEQDFLFKATRQQNKNEPCRGFLILTRDSRVYAIETDPELFKVVGSIFEEISFPNLTYKHGDVFAGWPEAGPFDAIVATAAYPRLPPALLEQLKPGGRFMVPVGPPGEQAIVLFSKDVSGNVKAQPYMSVGYAMMPGSEVSAPSARPENAGEIARLILERFDKDRDGVVSRKEFDGPAEAFEKVDIDGDGKWSRQEILRDLQSRLRGVR